MKGVGDGLRPETKPLYFQENPSFVQNWTSKSLKLYVKLIWSFEQWGKNVNQSNDILILFSCSGNMILKSNKIYIITF